MSIHERTTTDDAGSSLARLLAGTALRAERTALAADGFAREEPARGVRVDAARCRGCGTTGLVYEAWTKPGRAVVIVRCDDCGHWEVW